LDWACWLVWLEANDYDLHNSSGSLIAAIRRASSFVSNLAADRRPGSSSKYNADFTQNARSH
jgi:hypothetical protein